MQWKMEEEKKWTKSKIEQNKPKNLPFLLSYRLGRPSKDEQKKCKPKTINIGMQNKVLLFIVHLFFVLFFFLSLWIDINIKIYIHIVSRFRPLGFIYNGNFVKLCVSSQPK